MSIFSSKLTYGDFRRTGAQDCGNVLDYDDFDLSPGRTPEQIVAEAFAAWEADGMEEQWLSQQEDDWDGLDPHKCYEAWRDGWQGCAEPRIAHQLRELEKDRAYDRENPPANWWRKPAPTKDRVCYRTKIEALTKFLETNYQIVENYGGADYKVSPSEFDAINHKYDLKGKRAARTIAEAVWAAMPVGKPFCLDRIDLDALNDTSPAREAGIAFVLPDIVYATQMAAQEAQHYAPEPEPAWVTEHDEPERVFPPLPPIPAGPMRLHLERREGHAETYQMLPPLPPLGEVKPVNVELESQEPGVSTFRFNPAVRWRVWFSESPDSYVTVSAGGYMDAMRLAAPQFKGAHDGETREMIAKIDGGRAIEALVTIGHGGRLTFHPAPSRGNPAGKVKIKMTSTRSGNVGWVRADGTPSNHEGDAGYFTPAEAEATIAEYTENLVRTVGRCANRFEMIPVPNRNARTPNMKPIENPAWVTNILSKHFVALEEQVPPQWLPKLTKPGTSRGKLVASLKEYGCGAYGCVLPTLDPNVVLKLTTDDTEAQFAYEMAHTLSVPVVVKYHLTRALPDKYKGRQAYLLWRDSAERVGEVEQALAEEGADPIVVEEAIGVQHKAAQEAFDALHEGRPAAKLIQKWEDAAREMGLLVPELSELAEGMITNLHNNKVFFGDVHAGNIGRVNGRWVVVDPGHVAVLEE